MSKKSNIILYHIPVCPFSQRLEILLCLKGLEREVEFRVIDITQPRPAWLLEKTRGTTALPVLETPEGGILKESLILMRYLESVFPERPVAQRDPYRHAVESMLGALERDFVSLGYRYVMNQDPELTSTFRRDMLSQYAALNAFLLQHSETNSFLFEDFGWAEAIFTPFFVRFCFLDYYEGFELPNEEKYARVRAFRDACLAHPAAQQVGKEEIVKVYYDYAQGLGNGGLLPGRTRSSFALEPSWRDRPWPPKQKYQAGATDEALGL